MNRKANASASIEISATDFEAEVLNSKLPVLVAFWTTWSRPCQVLGPALEEVARACAGRVKVVKINADDNPDLGLWYEIQSVPTMLCFVNKILRARIVGTASTEAILAKLKSVLQLARIESASATPKQGH